MAIDSKILIIASTIIMLRATRPYRLRNSRNESVITSLSKKEKEEIEKLLVKPIPQSFIDIEGREWTPCSEWFLGKNIPNWPVGIWPGQVQYLYKPIDLADWLGCIAGYSAHVEDLEKAIQVDFKNEAKTVETTRLVTLKRKQLQKYVACRLKALNIENSKFSCEG